MEMLSSAIAIAWRKLASDWFYGLVVFRRNSGTDPENRTAWQGVPIYKH